MLATLWLLQATIVVGPPAPTKAPLSPAPVVPAPCPRDAKGDIVVCALPDQNEQYRLRPLPEKYVEQTRLQQHVGNAVIAPSIEQGRLGDGRVMLNFTFPF
jgi:hypothetical protein